MATSFFFLQTGDANTTPYRYVRGARTDPFSGTETGTSRRPMGTSRGGSATSQSTTTVSGPTNGVTFLGRWYTAPVSADVTISTNIVFNMRGDESSMSANAAINCLVYKVSATDASVTQIVKTANTTELATSQTAYNFSATPTSTTLHKGDRLLFIPFVDDASGVNMGNGYSATFYFGGPTADASGDSYVTFGETFSVQTSDPSGTTVYPTTTSAGINPGSATEYEAWTSRGSGATTAVTNTTTGPTSAIQITASAGGTAVEWYTKQLQAATLSGVVSVKIRAASGVYGATLRCEIAKVASDGTSPVVWGIGGSGTSSSGYDYTALALSEESATFYVAGDDLSISDGERLRIRIFIDDPDMYNSGMTGSSTVTVYYAGSSGGSGDTYATFPITLTEYSSGTPKSGSDSGTATDASSSLTVAVSGSEAPTGTDAASLVVSVSSVGDSGTGADAASKSVSWTGSDSGTGADAATLAAALSSADPGAGTDTASRAAALSGTDAGAGADAATLAAALAGTDPGAGTDTAVSVEKATSDSGTGADAATLAAALSGTDAGAGADAATLAAALSGTDAGAGADAASKSEGAVEKSGSDAGAGADAATLEVALSSADPGAGADAATLAAALSAGSESATGTDTADKSVSHTASDAGVGSEGGGGGSTIGSDTFTETSNVALTSHTAETGGTWSQWLQSPSGMDLWIDASQDYVYTVNPDDWTDRITIGKLGSVSLGDGSVSAWIWNNPRYGGVVARTVGTNNAYLFILDYVGYLGSNMFRLYRLTAGGWSLLSQAASSVDAATLLLEVTGSSPTGLRAKYDGGSWLFDTSDNTTGNQAASGGVGIILNGYKDSEGSGDELSIADTFTVVTAGGGGSAASVAVAVAGAEAPSATDTATALAVTVSATESAAGSDSATVDTGTTEKSGSDSGTGTDAASLAVAASATESATGTDASSSVEKWTSETGTGADAATLAATLTATDAGAGADVSYALTVAVSGSDAGTGTEAGTKDEGVVFKDGSEAATGTDAATLTVEVGGSETATGTDSSYSLVLSGSDAATATDAATALEVTVSGSEAATGTDAATLAAAFSKADSGTGTDAASLVALLSASESALGDDGGAGVSRASKLGSQAFVIG